MKRRGTTNRAAHAPDEREKEDGLHVFRALVDLFGRLVLLPFPRIKQVELAVHQIQETVEQRAVDRGKWFIHRPPQNAARRAEVRVEQGQQLHLVRGAEGFR